MTAPTIRRLASIKDVSAFQEYLRTLNLNLPCDASTTSANSLLLDPIDRGDIKIGNRIAINPMEGWDGTPDGKPTEQHRPPLATLRPKRRQTHLGRRSRRRPSRRPSKPQSTRSRRRNTRDGLAQMRAALIEAHKRTIRQHRRPRHRPPTHPLRPLLPPQRQTSPSRASPTAIQCSTKNSASTQTIPLLTDAEIEGIIEDYILAARIAARPRLRFRRRQALPRLPRPRNPQRPHPPRQIRRLIRKPHPLPPRNRRTASAATFRD